MTLNRLTTSLEFEPQPGDRAEMPSGEVGTIVQVLSKVPRRNGTVDVMLQVQTDSGLRIWRSGDLASIVRESQQ